jgi:2-phosphoglycerate kinase
MTDKLAVRWMTTGEAARALGISKARVVTLALREVLRHSVVKPYHPVILRTSVDAYIAARKNVAVNNTVGVA